MYFVRNYPKAVRLSFLLDVGRGLRGIGREIGHFHELLLLSSFEPNDSLMLLTNYQQCQNVTDTDDIIARAEDIGMPKLP